MESFYDRELGIAWGPITKQEMLDDLFLYVNKDVKERRSLSCDPAFEDKDQRWYELTRTENRSPRSEIESAIVLSDEGEVTVAMDKPDVRDRLPTPVHIDDHTFDQILNISGDDFSKSENEIADSIDREESHRLPSNETHAEIDNLSDKSDSVFNDTIAEMEKLLNEGLNYIMDTDTGNDLQGNIAVDEKSSVLLDNCAENLPQTPARFDIPSIKIRSCSETKPKSHNTGAIKKKPMPKTITKIPVAPTFVQDAKHKKLSPRAILTPVNQQKQVPRPISASSSSLKKRYKDIESPISLYIKNAGVTRLYKKITPTKSSASGTFKLEKMEKINKENSLIFPDVMYKPAKRAIVTKTNDIKLPNKIESLIAQKPNVIKHEGRIGGCSQKQSSIRKKLSEADLTVSSNISLDTTEDISIRCSKRAYIK